MIVIDKSDVVSGGIERLGARYAGILKKVNRLAGRQVAGRLVSPQSNVLFQSF